MPGVRGRDVNAGLSDAYCRACIAMGHGYDQSTIEAITPEMIELKRVQIQMRRAANQIREAASKLGKDQL